MDTAEKVREALRTLQSHGKTADFLAFLARLKGEDPLAFSVIEVFIHTMDHRFSRAIKKGENIIPRLGDRPWVVWRLLMVMGKSYFMMGDLDRAMEYTERALELAEFMGDQESISRTRLQICTSLFLKAEYDLARNEFLRYSRDPLAWEPQRVKYYLALIEVIRGNPREALRVINPLLEQMKAKTQLWYTILEVNGLALRLLGKLSEAAETLLESASGLAEYNSSYSAFPAAKALKLARFTGLEPPPRNLIKKALSLAKKGGWGEQAAAQEIAALLKEDDSEAAEGLYEAAKNYLRAYQNIEALLSGLTAAYLAWKTDSPVFTKALKLIAPLIPLHPGFKKDPILGDFMAEMEPFLRKALGSERDKEGIRAYLVGGLRVIVDGKEISMRGWRNNKAIKGLVYLLLSQKHRIPSDHLFYLLWPRRAFNEKTRYYLYNAMATVRRNLGRPKLLARVRDFYQLEDAWTDLGEIENLLRLADATRDPAEREEYLAKARELARGDLLPEFPYDRHIEEYRYHYERLRKRLGLE